MLGLHVLTHHINTISIGGKGNFLVHQPMLRPSRGSVCVCGGGGGGVKRLGCKCSRDFFPRNHKLSGVAVPVF